MGLEVGDRLGVVLQHELFLLIRGIVATALTVAVEDLFPVKRAQGEDSVQDCGFAEARLED